MAELANIITYEDFKGNYSLSIEGDPAKAILNDAIEQTQRNILIDLLSEPLYIDLVNNKTETKYKTLIYANDGYVTYEGSDGKNYIYRGFKEMLANFTWFYYKIDRESFDSNTGNNTSVNVNSQKALSSLYNKSVNNWNRGIKLYYESVDYINRQNNINGDDYYPEFEYKYLDLINTYGL